MEYIIPIQAKNPIIDRLMPSSRNHAVSVENTNK
jgi:hypothetical protein